MPKHGFLTPKAIGNRIKAKGLQKLRWYCQMCQKQCRDENGFKCHCMSESHQRQMEVFGQNVGKHMDEFSQVFEQDFMKVLSHSYGTKRVHSNTVYQEYIKDRHHQHMNSTRWSSLGEFVQYLGRSGKAVIDYQEDGGLPGWYMVWVEHDPVKKAKAEAFERRKDAERKQEEKMRKKIETQRQVAAKVHGEVGTAIIPSEMSRDGGQKMSFSLSAKKDKQPDSSSPDQSLPMHPPSSTSTSTSSDSLKSDHASHEPERSDDHRARGRDDDDHHHHPHHHDHHEHSHSHSHHHDTSVSSSRKRKSSPPVQADRDDHDRVKHSKQSHFDLSGFDVKESASRVAAPPTALEALVRENEATKARLQAEAAESSRRDNWLHTHTMVKIMNKALGGGRFYKKKGSVTKVEGDGFLAVVRMESAGEILKIDQDELETVIPKPGGRVMVVNGPLRGRTGEVKRLDLDRYKAVVLVDSVASASRENRVEMEYEDICRLHPQDWRRK